MIYLRLFIAFMKIGFTSFGGMSMIPVIMQEMKINQWMTAEDLTNLIAIAEMTPGPLGINCATFAGMQTAGVLGGIAAVMGVLMPAYTLTLGVAVCFAKFRGNDIMSCMLNVIKPICIAMILAVILDLMQENYFPDARIDWFGCGIGVVMFYLILKKNWSVPKVITLAAVFGIVGYGVLAGALTTAVLQSSSTTTVMAIGFVSAGLMNLPQAISIIFGANIGTTMTAQIIAFKISDYIYVIIFIGFLISFVTKSEKVKSIGQTIFAFGLLFLGIETMGDVMKPLASSPVFTDLIGRVAHIPVLGVAVGTVMTLVVQSSSATIAVLQNFASQPGPDGVTSILGLAGAIPILLGDNIGTTITALLASIGQSKDAKRTAVAHCIFNISGCFLFIWFVKPFAALIQNISPKGPEIEAISRQIANAHTVFNITMTLIWVCLIKLMVKIVMTLIPDGKKGVEDPGSPIYLDENIISQPAAQTASLMCVLSDVERMGTTCKNLKFHQSKVYRQIFINPNLNNY